MPGKLLEASLEHSVILLRITELAEWYAILRGTVDVSGCSMACTSLLADHPFFVIPSMCVLTLSRICVGEKTQKKGWKSLRD